MDCTLTDGNWLGWCVPPGRRNYFLTEHCKLRKHSYLGGLQMPIWTKDLFIAVSYTLRKGEGEQRTV